MTRSTACKRVLFAALCWALTAGAADQTADPAVRAATAEPAEVQVLGDTLVYRGNLSVASTRAWQQAVAALPPGQLRRLVIASGGGDTVEGRRLGRWVHQANLRVEVDTICFSSCADYVFPAGRSRAIRSGAIVGWHGNERSLEVQAARAGLDLKTYFVQRFGAEIAQAPPAQREGLDPDAFIERQLAALRLRRAAPMSRPSSPAWGRTTASWCAAWAMCSNAAPISASSRAGALRWTRWPCWAWPTRCTWAATATTRPRAFAPC